MAASSNSSLSGSSVSSGKFLRRAPHFFPPSILAGSYLSAERLAVPPAPRSPAPPAAAAVDPQPRAGSPPGGGGAPARGRQPLRRRWGGEPGPGSRDRAPPRLCAGRGRGEPRDRLPGRGSSIPPGEGRGAPAAPRASPAGTLAAAPAPGFGWPRVFPGHLALPTDVPCRGPRGAGPAPQRSAGRARCPAGRGRPAVPLGGRRGTQGVLSTCATLGTIKFPMRVKTAPGGKPPRGLGGGGRARVRGAWACSGFCGCCGGRRCGAACCPSAGEGWLPAGRQKSYGAFLEREPEIESSDTIVPPPAA